ncbi:MAG: hypothetical protein Q7T85_13220 [Nitrosomonas sp.]|nr:hypothetical protein [Nitrosomonas sp.]
MSDTEEIVTRFAKAGYAIIRWIPGFRVVARHPFVSWPDHHLPCRQEIYVDREVGQRWRDQLPFSDDIGRCPHWSGK